MNTTVAYNTARSGSAGSGVYQVTAWNSIVYYNQVQSPTRDQWRLSTFYYSCTSPLPSGTGNITADPQLLWDGHLPTTSPCRGAGSTLYASGLDIDGEPWAGPPSMGCDEIWEANLTGPLQVSLRASYTAIVVGHWLQMSGQVTGRVSRVAWDYGDGTGLTDPSRLTTAHIWTNTGDFTVTFTAFNTDHPQGVATNLTITVLPLVLPTLTIDGVSNNVFRVSFVGQQGVFYTLQQSTNLTPPSTWQTVSMIYGDGNTQRLRDQAATNAARFYRLRVQ